MRFAPIQVGIYGDIVYISSRWKFESVLKICEFFEFSAPPAAGQILRIKSTARVPYFGQLLGAGSAPTSPPGTDSKSYYSTLASFAEFKSAPEKFGACKRHILIGHFTRPHQPMSDIMEANSDRMGIWPHGAAEVPKCTTLIV